MERSENKTSKTEKRYTLVLPQSTFDEVQNAASEQGTNIAALLRRFITLGFEVERSIENGGVLVRRVNNQETELFLI